MINPLHRRLLGLLVVLALLLALAGWRRAAVRPAPAPGRLTPATAEAAARDYLAIEAREQAADHLVWALELEAERHEDEFMHLWDALNASSNRWATLADFPVRVASLPEIVPAGELQHGIRGWRNGQVVANELRDPAAWRTWLERWPAAGWNLERTHWQLTTHQPATNGRPAHSRVAVTAQLENPGIVERAVLRAWLDVDWQADTGGVPVVDRIAVAEVELFVRAGPPPFRLWLDEEIPVGGSIFTDPLLVADLDGDGRSDVALVGANRVWWNRAAGQGVNFVPGPLGNLPAERTWAAALADVNVDGHADLVLAGAEGVSWFAGGAGAGFPGERHVAWRAPQPLKHPQAIAAGDVDGDGDVDLWVVQYKLPYQQGQFPTPWFDANDGFPAYLLLNDGHGNFVDDTEASGLAAKRFRRGYSASFVDLDGDGDLDLINVSDFAGLDVFLNDGHGRFTDVSGTLGEARHGFGMAHAVSDFNADGRPDVLMLGMGSPVVDRMEAAGVERAPDSVAMRRAMTFGNRLFLGAASPGNAPLVPGPAAATAGLARTGWTWGAAWADFDNDGDLDLAAANGHETRASVRDYERQFWRHDRFVAGSTNSLAADYYFRTAAGRRQAEQASYGGWQDNSFVLNQDNRAFADVAWLLGVADPADSRNVVAEDLDGDGRLDLIVTTQEEWPRRQQRLKVYRNELDAGNWVGFRFASAPPPGTKVELDTASGTQARWLVTGDGYRSQGSASVHFGLGLRPPVAARVIWPGGRTNVLEVPVVNAWQRIELSR